jgi:hypothetical protein
LHLLAERRGVCGVAGFVPRLLADVKKGEGEKAVVCDQGYSRETSFSKRLRYIVVLVARQHHVLGEIDLHAMPLANCDRWRDLDEAVEDCGGG